MEKKKNSIDDDIRDLFPNNLGSKAYLSDIGKKSRKNKTSKNTSNIKYKVYFPKYEGKVYDPTLSKALNILKQNENQIIKDIQKRNGNINLLKSETYKNNINNIKDLDKEKKKNEERIKILEKENNLCIEKLEEIKNRRIAMQYQQEKELGILEKNKKLRLKKFLEDINNKEKNELIEEKFKKLQENSKKIQLKMQEDLKEAIDRKQYDLDKIKKENEEKIKQYLNEMKNKEKEDIKIRNQNSKEQILKLKNLIKKKPDKTTNVYKQLENNYLNDEENKIKKENMERKAYMKHIDLNEFNEFAKNFDENKSKKLMESNLKREKEKEKWSQRYKLIPEYINPINKKILEDEQKIKKEEEKVILEKKKYKELQKKYRVPKPLIIVKEKKENNDKLNSLKKPLIKSSSYSDVLRQKIMIKMNTSKNKKERGAEDSNKTDNKNLINFKLPLISLKEKAKKINKSFEKEKNNKKHQLITDYLRQRRIINEQIREKKRNSGELTNLDYTQTNDIKKLIKENGMDEGMLKLAKSKLEILEEKKKEKSLLLRLNGGIDNKPELGEEICDLIIDSIQSKLAIIEEIEYLNEKNNCFNISREQNEDANEE